MILERTVDRCHRTAAPRPEKYRLLSPPSAGTRLAGRQLEPPHVAGRFQLHSTLVHNIVADRADQPRPRNPLPGRCGSRRDLRPGRNSPVLRNRRSGPRRRLAGRRLSACHQPGRLGGNRTPLSDGYGTDRARCRGIARQRRLGGRVLFDADNLAAGWELRVAGRGRLRRTIRLVGGRAAVGYF